MRRLTTFVAILFVAVVAYASSLYPAVQQLDSDCAARIAAIGTPPATKKLAKEANGLAKVRTQLAKYTGGQSVKDLRTVGKAGPLLVASGTRDPAILTDVQTILGCFEDAVTNRLNNAQDELSLLLDPAHIAFIKTQMTLAKTYFDAGKAALPSNPVVAAAWFIKAYDLYGWNIARAQKLYGAEQGSPPPAGIGFQGSASTLAIQNVGPADYDVSKVRVFANVESNSTVVKTFSGESAKALVPTFLAAKGSNVLAASTTFDLTAPLLRPLAADAGAPTGRIYGVLWVYLKGQKFIVVRFDVTLS
jgi:hypothetical protein